MDPTVEAIKANLFPASHAAIHDWNRFSWHRPNGIIQTHKIHSSQALAIDVFGTIKVSDERDRIFSALAKRCELADDGPWTLELEWTDSQDLLGEPRPTQVDVIAFGPDTLLLIECKFTEIGGGCSQPNQISKGAHKGLRQCSGDYALQTNPVNGHAARCALTAKGVRYWETIPKIFGLDLDKDYRPCPFRGDAYQWMRNAVLADRIASARGVSSAVIAAYADAEGFVTAKKVRTGSLGHAGSGRTLVLPVSYQSIVDLARSLSEYPQVWNELARWVERKIEAVALGKSQNGASHREAEPRN
jgi:hypothetical protein